MLTIREPIALKTNRSIQGIHQDMEEKMQANYGLMNLSVRKEELLHITSQPPEIYFAEGDSLQILTNIHQQNQQEIRLDVINNLLNRILVAQTDNFTYQDTVYISSVLRKLGIRDEKTFMRQVFLLQNEQKETRYLLQRYEANQEILQQLFSTMNDSKKEEKEQKEETSERELRLFIHNEIFKRLETGKIYQDVSNFNKNILQESQEIYAAEMQTAEQTRISQNLLLQDIKNTITKNQFPLQYVHNNRYEYLQEVTREMTEELEEQMSAAILLNLSDQIYSLRQQRIEENQHYWYSIAGALFRTAENTWKRYEANLLERRHFSVQMNRMLEETNHIRHQEGDVINTLADEYINIIQQWTQENQNNREVLIQKNIQENWTQEISISGGSYQLSREELELNYLMHQEETQEQEEAGITVEQLQKQLEMYSQKNYENYRKITEIGRQQQIVKNRKVDRKKAQIDALRALDDPTEVLKEYLVSDRKEPLTVMQEKTQKQIYELFSEETREIYRQYLLQNTNTENTFLQHIMAQPQESEIRQEVIQALEQVERQENLQNIRPVVTESVEQIQPVISNTIREKMKEQLLVWRELQEQSGRFVQDDEIFMNRESGEISHIHEEKLTGMKETTEERILRQQIEKTVLDHNTKREMENRQMDYIYKTEETLNSEELLEEIRRQNQRTRKTEQTEEITIKKERYIQALEQIERQENLQNIRPVVTESVEQIQPVISNTIREKMKEQLLVWRELQEQPGRFVQDDEIFMDRESREILHIHEEKLTGMKETIENRILRQQMEKTVLDHNTKREMENRQIDFIYKTEETLNSEELLEEIRLQNQRTRKTEQTEEMTIKNERDIHRTVQETVNHVQTNRMDNIEELIQQSVRRQLNSLSDQVYGKLEKKLQTERKRRGYY